MNCVLYDRECTDCGECDICDLDRNKRCDSCGRCLDSEFDYKAVKIDEIMLGDD
ncbi:MAG: hypothetical protein BWY15_00020 [Firmicutes bacterium ADurb.Bin193]|nr:MAG: hypothetical protein BWY15_00020 [Firmicutes bacterium ADurb.Bin193]